MPRVHFACHDVGASSPAQPRIAAWVRGLRERGRDVVLWTAREPGPWARAVDVRQVHDPILDLYRRAGGGSGNGPLAKTPSLVVRAGRAVQDRLLFPDHEVLWSRAVRRRLCREIVSGDVVVTCTRPESVGLVGEAAQRRGARWWFDFADGWCAFGLRGGAMREGPRRQRELALEARQVRAADVVSTVCEELAGYLAGVRGRDDIVVYPNIIPDELTGLPPMAAGRSTTPRVAHYGRLSLSDSERTLQPLLRVLERTPDAVATWRFRGDLGDRDLTEIDALRALGHTVEVLPAVPRAELVADRQHCDGALFVSSPAQVGTSSKLLDLMGLRLPVFALANPTSAAARIVREAGIGETAPLDDPDAGAAAWRRFVLTCRSPADHAPPPATFDRYHSNRWVPSLCDRIATLAAVSRGS